MNRVEVPNNLRCVIVTLHGLCSWSFTKIQKETQGLIARNTASDIWHHTVTSAQIALKTTSIPSWNVLLDYVQPVARSGRPKRLSAALKTRLRSELLINKHTSFFEVARSL